MTRAGDRRPLLVSKTAELADEYRTESGVSHRGMVCRCLSLSSLRRVVATARFQ